MLSRSSIMVLCFGRDLFPRVSLHEDLHVRSTHCMQIILMTRFQFLHWVMKNALFLKVTTIIKTYFIFWFKMKQTLPGFCVICFTSAFASASFSARFQGVTWLRQSLHSKTLSTTHNGETRPRKLQRRKVEVTR